MGTAYSLLLLYEKGGKAFPVFAFHVLHSVVAHMETNTGPARGRLGEGYTPYLVKSVYAHRCAIV